jgi:hypothetical protein
MSDADEYEKAMRNEKALLRGFLLAIIGQLRSIPLVTLPGQEVQRRMLENITAEWIALCEK